MVPTGDGGWLELMVDVARLWGQTPEMVTYTCPSSMCASMEEQITCILDLASRLALARGERVIEALKVNAPHVSCFLPLRTNSVLKQPGI